jgi:hypothetical protein
MISHLEILNGPLVGRECLRAPGAAQDIDRLIDWELKSNQGIENGRRVTTWIGNLPGHV